MDFGVPVDHGVTKKDNEKIKKYLNLARDLKITVEHEDDVDTNCNWCTWNGPQKTKGLDICGRIGTIQTTVLLRSARIFRRYPDI